MRQRSDETLFVGGYQRKLTTALTLCCLTVLPGLLMSRPPQKRTVKALKAHAALTARMIEMLSGLERPRNGGKGVFLNHCGFAPFAGKIGTQAALVALRSGFDGAACAPIKAGKGSCKH